MENAAHAESLKTALSDHLKETETQVERLESIFKNHDEKPKRETCKAMKGLIAEGESEMEEWSGSDEVCDAAIIASAQRVEHYEMAGYGTAKCFATMLGFTDDIDLLDESLEEEREADSKLSDIAFSTVNPSAITGQSSNEPSARA
jgi:ferritin-like metal-binding protein YciE